MMTSALILSMDSEHAFFLSVFSSSIFASSGRNRYFDRCAFIALISKTRPIICDFIFELTAYKSTIGNIWSEDKVLSCSQLECNLTLSVSSHSLHF